MKLTLRTLSALLGYPSVELQAAVPELREALAGEAVLPRAARRRLEPLLCRLHRGDLLENQAHYSGLFDRTRALSLNLFEHVHGDSRDRGQAMIDLGEQYIARGFLLDSTELPDFIPVFVEFASCLPPSEAREILGEPSHVFAALEARLADQSSPYGAVFAALIAVSEARPDRAALAELEASVPDDDPSRIDEEWEEAPVTFNSHEMGGPTGIVAKLRAAGKAMVAARSGH